MSDNPLWSGWPANALSTVQRDPQAPVNVLASLSASNGVTPADAWALNSQAAQDWIAQQRAISAQQGLWNDQTGLPTPAGMVDAARQYGSGLLMGSTAPGAKGFTAYHGSPHDFDAFDASKIGTGEGAQAYGHGMYFADAEGVAKSYRDQLARTDYSTSAGGRVPDWIGNSIARVQDDPNLVKGVINGHLQDFEARLADERALLNTARDPWNVQGRIDNLQGIIDELGKLKSGDATLLPRGRMYEVQVNADPAHFLDWDKPLSEQHPVVQKALGDLGFTPNAPGQAAGAAPRRGPVAMPEPTGAGVYARLSGGDYGGKREAAAQALRDAGIPGIRYLDQGSRGAGDGSRNSVVFDPSILNIVRKYAVPLSMLSGVGHGLITSSDAEGQ